MSVAGDEPGGYPADLVRAAARFLGTAAPGTRVVARYRIDTGFTDALGELVSRDDLTCVIRTRRGEVTVRVADVVAAKQVPPPPPRRPASGQGSA